MLGRNTDLRRTWFGKSVRMRWNPRLRMVSFELNWAKTGATYLHLPIAPASPWGIQSLSGHRTCTSLRLALLRCLLRH